MFCLISSNNVEDELTGMRAKSKSILSDVSNRSPIQRFAYSEEKLAGSDFILRSKLSILVNVDRINTLLLFNKYMLFFGLIQPMYHFEQNHCRLIYCLGPLYHIGMGL